MFQVKWLKAVKLLLQAILKRTLSPSMLVSVQTLGICTVASVIFVGSEPDILDPPSRKRGYNLISKQIVPRNTLTLVCCSQSKARQRFQCKDY